MTVYLIGIGLNDEKDMSHKGVEAAKKCERVYLEDYTGLYGGTIESLNKLIGKGIIRVDRKDIEQNPGENVLFGKDAALLVMGDPMVATTHQDLVLRARQKGHDVRIIHGSSVQSAICECGLQSYKFGRTTTIAYPEGSYFPLSPYDVICENIGRGLHTLCLLDLRADEKRYMSVPEALKLLKRMEDERGKKIISNETTVVGAARLGGEPVFRAGSPDEVGLFDFGGPPHCLVICAKLHEMESLMLDYFRV